MSVASKTPGCQLDEHLKYISVRTQWGCQKEKLLAGAGCSTVLAGEGKGAWGVCVCECVCECVCVYVCVCVCVWCSNVL
jgi:hypothetical protein